MEEPKRLLEDPATSDAVRSELENALRAPAPPYDTPKGLERLLAATGAGGAGAAGAAGAAGSSIAKSVHLLSAKSLIVGGVLVGMVTAGAVVHHRRAERSASPPETPAVVTAGAAATASPPSSTASPDLPPSPSSEEAAPSVPAPPSDGHPRASRAHARGSDSAAASAANDRIAREVALVGRARSALARNPQEALAITEEGQRDFPGGVLREEREAIAVLALSRLGRRDEANARGQAFLARYPGGPFAERVRLALAGQGDSAPNDRAR